MDPIGLVDNNVRFFVYHKTWLYTGYMLYEFEYDLSTQTFVTFKEYLPNSGTFGTDGGMEFTLPRTYGHTATSWGGKISPW